MEESWRDLGRAVAYARRKEGLSQKGLESRLKNAGTPVSDRTIRDLEGGKPVSTLSLDRIGDALHWAPDIAAAILQGLLKVGLAGELLPAEDGAGPARLIHFTGSGKTAAANTAAPLPPWVPTLREAREAVADHERDLALAIEELKDHLNRMAHSVESDPLRAAHEVDHALGIADKVDMAVRGANWWRLQVDALRRDEEGLATAARRGSRASENPEPHAE